MKCLIASRVGFALLLCTATAAAEPTRGDLARPLPGGIVFPSLYSSIEQNPAGLLQEKRTVVGLDWQIPFQGNAPAGVTEGFSSGGKYFGMGALIGGTAVGNVVTLNRASVAAAVGMTGSALGVNATYDLATGTGIDCDLGLAVENASGFQLSVLLTSVQAFRTTGAFNVGFGFTQPRQVQVEGSWSYTLFSPTQQHVLAANAIFYSGSFGFGANVAYTTSTAGASTSLGPALSLSFSNIVTLTLRGYYDTALGTRMIAGGNVSF